MASSLAVIHEGEAGREGMEWAAQILRALLGSLRLYEGEVRAETPPLTPALLERAQQSGSVLLGPLSAACSPPVLDALTTAMDLYAVLLPLAPAGVTRPLLVVEHPQPGVGALGDRLSPAQAWAATRLGNLAGALLPEKGRVVLAHDSEREFVRSVTAGTGLHVALEHLDAVFFANQFTELAPEFDLILSSARTGRLLLGQAARLDTRAWGRVLVGTGGHVAMPLPETAESQGEATEFLATLHAAGALLRYAWDDARSAARLDAALAHAVRSAEPEDPDTLGGMAQRILAALRTP